MNKNYVGTYGVSELLPLVEVGVVHKNYRIIKR